MSKLSECELINRFLSNIRQVRYIFEFKINQKDFTRSFIFVNELKENFEWICSLSDFFLRRAFEISAKRPYHIVWLHYKNRKLNVFNGKNRQFLTSKTEHTDHLLRLNTEHTESFKTEHAESLLRPKMTIPNLSYVRKPQNRTKLSYRSFLKFDADNTEDFFQFFFVFVRLSQLGNISVLVRRTYKFVHISVIVLKMPKWQ